MTCISPVHYLQLNNDNPVEIDGVMNVDGEYVSNATITLTLYTTAETPAAVSGATGLTMSYISVSNGRYRAIIPSTVSLTADTEYTIVILAEVTGDAQTRIEAPALALVRTA